MEDARIVLDYIDVLVWPLVVVGLLVAFRSQVFRLLNRLVKLDAAGVSATFEAEVQEAETVANERRQPTSEKPRVEIRRKITPSNYREGAREIAEAFRDGEALYLDLSKTDDDDEAKRIVDFVAGVVFQDRGLIERLRSKTFVIIPGRYGPWD